jgi:hypothetical protein
MNSSGYVLATILAFSVLVSAVHADQGESLDLVGNWTGTSTGHMKYGGYNETSIFSYRLNIKEQYERCFNGSFYVTVRGKTHTIGFSGVIGRDLQSLYLTEYEGGIDIGKIISPDEIELAYLQDGKKGMAMIERFFRDRDG